VGNKSTLTIATMQVNNIGEDYLEPEVNLQKYYHGTKANL
jgi:hypothetical protein